MNAVKPHVVVLALALAAANASPRDTKASESHFTLTVSGFFSATFSGTGPLSYARRRSAVGKAGERLEIKLRSTSPFGKLDLDATPDVTGKPAFGEAGRYDIGNLGAVGTITLGNLRRWTNARTGELVLEESDERHVKGRLDFKGPCRTGPEPGTCSVHAEFDLTRQR
jgi:hypothetical protein